MKPILTLNARVSNDNDHPRGMIFTDATTPGTILKVRRAASDDAPTLDLVVFKASDADENGCTINAADAATLGINLDTLIIGNAPYDLLHCEFIEKDKKSQNGGGIKHEDRPKCLTALEFDEAMLNAETFKDMLFTTVDQLTALGYQLGASTLLIRAKEWYPDAY